MLSTLSQAVVSQWADPALMRGWPASGNAQLTHVVMLLLLRLGFDGIEASGALLRAILQVR